jgi:aryl-alcohol dehydrogenase-like predicted oxidoreductase
VEGRRGVSRFASRSDRKEIEDSLRQLRTDVIDLYQVHWPDLETPIAETARTLEDLRREGKIRALGVSNYAPAQMDTFRAVAKLDAVQPPYNLFEREIEADVLPYAKGAGLTVLSYLCRLRLRRVADGHPGFTVPRRADLASRRRGGLSARTFGDLWQA